jgi:hypothetical protein
VNQSLLPIRKLIAAAIATALLLLAKQLDVELSDTDAQAAAQAIVPLVVFYLTPDPRVS